LLAPSNGESIPLPNPVNFAATASDSDGSIAKVEFWQGGTKVGEATSAPYTFSWNATPGSYSLTAVAQDNGGSRTTSTAATVTVTNAPPAVAITAPLNGQGFRTGDPVNIAASASDIDSTIAKVEFWQGTTKLGEDVTAPFTFAWNPPAGAFTLTAIAQDNFGARTTSAAVGITVSANSPPLVTLLAPSNGESIPLPNPVNFAATASDSDGTIAKVEFWQGTTKLGEAISPPYTFTWAATPGSYNLTAIAQDNNGARTTSATATVTVTNQPPVIALNSPANGASITLPENLTITATATDADSAIARVEFFQGATLLHQDTTPPYSHVWAAPPGNYSITAVAVDAHGARTTSAAAAITVVNPAPTIAISSPANGSTVNLPGPVTITADANDADGSVAKVEFYLGATKLGEDASAPFSWPWSPITGSYMLSCIAQDDRGARATSATVAVTIANPNNQAPAVAIANPSNGQTLPANTAVSLSANATDSDGVIAKVEFFQGSTKISEDSSAPFTATWPGAVAGSYSFTAIATDNDGGVTTSAPVAITLVNNIPPIVAITSPIHGAAVTGGSVNITATASDSDGTVTKVEFYRNGVKQGEDATSPFSFNWTGVPVGTHVLTVIAFDDDGATTTSAPVTIFAVSPVTLTFQDGVGGYTGTLDTYLREAASSSSYGSATGISVDSSDSSFPAHGLLRFDGIIGSGANQIPAGSTISSATLSFQVSNTGSGFNLHRMLTTWSEASTWSSMGSGISANNVEAASAVTASIGANSDSANVTAGLQTMTVTSAVQAWLGGSPNFGFALLPFPNGPNGVDFYTSEWSNASQRPKLSVTFVPPAPILPPTPVVTLAVTDAAAGEFGADKSLVFTVTRTGGTESALAIVLAASGAATSSNDFSGWASPMMIPAGQSSATLPLTVIADTLHEGPESVVVSIVADPAYTVSGATSVQGSIQDHPFDGWRFTKGVANTTNDAMLAYLFGKNPGEMAQGGVLAMREIQNPTLKLRFPRAQNHAGLSYRILWSRDLRNWHGSGETADGMSITIVESVVSPGSEDPETLEATATITPTPSSMPESLFFRIEAVLQR